MGRQTHLHVFPKDVNELLVAMHDEELFEVALRTGPTTAPDRLPFIPDNLGGQILVL